METVYRSKRFSFIIPSKKKTNIYEVTQKQRSDTRYMNGQKKVTNVFIQQEEL